jgi:hypothetical protein
MSDGRTLASHARSVPETLADHATRVPLISRPLEVLPGASTAAMPVPRDCYDGFMAAFWGRPEAYLHQRFAPPRPRGIRCRRQQSHAHSTISNATWAAASGTGATGGSADGESSTSDYDSSSPTSARSPMRWNLRPPKAMRCLATGSSQSRFRWRHLDRPGAGWGFGVRHIGAATGALFYDADVRPVLRGDHAVCEGRGNTRRRGRFQQSIWWRLEPLTDLTKLRILRCQAPDELARQRALTRMAAQPTRAAHATVSTFNVDTSDGWHPDLEEIAAFCRRR